MATIPEITHSDTIGKTLMLLVQTSHLIDKYIEAYLNQNADISFPKLMVLKILEMGNGETTPGQIAKWTHKELHSITTLVARLKKDGLVTTERSKSDKRNVRILLTNKGKTTLDQVKPVAEQLIKIAMSSISDNDVMQLCRILEVLRDNAYYGLESVAIEK